MLGFSTLSESPIGSLASFEFFIRGSSSISVLIGVGSSGKLDIFGNHNNIVEVATSSIGYIKITKRKKIMIAQALRRSIGKHAIDLDIHASSPQNTIHPVSSTKKIRVE